MLRDKTRSELKHKCIKGLNWCSDRETYIDLHIYRLVYSFPLAKIKGVYDFDLIPYEYFYEEQRRHKYRVFLNS